MQVSTQTQAILLLTAWFGDNARGGPAPLSPTEWGRFALYLLDIDLKPGDLLQVPDVGPLLAGFTDKKITTDRIRKLLGRSAALGLALEKWERAGLWVMTRSDPDYPKRWKARLRADAPPVLFGAGNRDLLNRGGISVVGSREIDAEQMEFTGKLGRDIAHQGQTVISGGARGADEAAMLGALASEGTAVGILADSLLRTCTSGKFRRALLSNDLALVSPFNPEAGFNVGNAMARNKYIYCLSDAAVVIAATENKGGTWSGAVEALRNKWVPVWVLRHGGAGNSALVEKGGGWLNEPIDVRQLAALGESDSEGSMAGNDSALAAHTPPLSPADHEGAYQQGSVASEQAESSGSEGVSEAPVQKEAPQDAVHETPYQFFISRLPSLLGNGGMSSKELQNATMLKQKQLKEWLLQAEADGVVVKTKSPAKYLLRGSDAADALFESEQGDQNADPTSGVQNHFDF